MHSLHPTRIAFAVLCMMLPASPGVGLPAPSGASGTGGPGAATQAAEEEGLATDGLPLEPDRTLRFTTDRGSWISVDVSPDGSTLVFDLLGDIYTLPIAGGEATPLLIGPAFEAQPRYSPDGERIVFVSDRSGGQNVWTLELEGGSEPEQITEGNDHLYTSPEWSPDGEYIVVSRTYSPLGGAAKPWLFHVEGGSGIELVDEPEQLKTLGLAFGPDPDRIWWAERIRDWTYDTQLPDYQLAVYDRRSGDKTVMTGRYGSAFRPAVSPDGRWLVYGTRHDEDTGLRVRDLETGQERWLAYPVQHDDQESRATLDVLPGYSFTPDGAAVVISYGGGLWRVPVDGSPATEIPFTVEAAIHVGPRLDFSYPVQDTPTFRVRQIRDAMPSPDGERIAFTAMGRLYVMELSGADPVQVVADGDGPLSGAVLAQPAWSPDGSRLAFVSWDDREGGHVWRVDVADGSVTRLTRVPAAWEQPAWSPDGERIVALRSPARVRGEGAGGSLQELVAIPIAGGDTAVVAPASGRSAPHFVTDRPDRIYLYSRSDGLVSIRWDGTDERAHLKVTGFSRASGGSPPPASLVLMAPEGGRALAQVESDLYVVEVPLVGAEAPTVSITSPERAPVPVRKLTEVGAQFPAWGREGRVHWSIGNAHFVYDLAAARAAEEAAEAGKAAEGAAKEGEESAGDVEAEPAGDSGAGNGGEDDAPAYRPREIRIEIDADRDLPGGVAVLRGARIVTMRDDEVIEEGEILVEGNRIAAVGTAGEVEVPAGAEVVDVSGTTIVPGFVDTHAHLRPDRGIHTIQPWEYLANLAFGVTTTRDPQTGTTDVLTYSDRQRAGEIVGPRIYSTGPGVFGSYQGEGIRDLDHARSILRRYSDYYDTKTFKMYLAGNRQQRQWLVMAARELGLMPTTEAGLDFALDLTHAMDGYPGIEHNLPIYPLYQDVVTLFAEAKVVNTPTLIVSFGGPMGESWFFTTENVHDDARLRRFTPHAVVDARARRRSGAAGEVGWAMQEEYVFDDHARFLADVIEAGGMAGVGSHGQLQGLGYHWEMWMLASGGMSPHDMLRSATLFGARAIGLEEDLGSIESGKLADLVILDSNPLEDVRATTSVRQVMLNGRLYDAHTLDEEWPRVRELPFRGFVEDEPEVEAGIRR